MMINKSESGALNSESNKSIPVVLLHAFPLNSAMWESQKVFLETLARPVIVPDFPGFGDEPLPPGPIEMSGYAEFIIRLLESSSVEKAVFIGLSMGGYVALSLFGQRPDLFAGLMLANTRAGADSPEGRERRMKTIEFLQKHRDLGPLIQFHLENFFTDQTRQENPKLVARIREMMQSAGIAGVIAALRAMAGRPDSHSLLSKMDFPVTVLAGADDPLTTVGDAEKMMHFLPQGALSIFQTAHLSNLEDADGFNRTIEKLLSKI